MEMSETQLESVTQLTKQTITSKLYCVTNCVHLNCRFSAGTNAKLSHITVICIQVHDMCMLSQTQYTPGLYNPGLYKFSME